METAVSAFLVVVGVLLIVWSILYSFDRYV